MLIRQISDLHNDVSSNNGGESYKFEPDARDKDTTLVIPGDIDMVKAKTRYGDFLQQVSEQFKYVVFCSGNHEYWGSNIHSTHRKIGEIIAERSLDNVFYLNDSSVVLDGVAFVGGTLWTNIKNPLVEIQVQAGMNDYRRIRTGPDNQPWQRKLRVSDVTMMHYKTRGFMQDEVKKQKAAGNKVVVVSHHAPSFKSVCPKHASDPLNPAYCSELDYWLMEGDIDYWMHGHIHWHHDYVIGHCRVTCNPRGYFNKKYGTEFTNYNDNFYVEII